MRRELLAVSVRAALCAGLFAASARADAPHLAEAEYPAPDCKTSGILCKDLARPESPDADVRLHDGLFVRGGFGVSAFRTPVPRAETGTFSTSAELLVGGTPLPGFVVGGGVIGEGLGTSYPLIAYAAFAQLYPDPRSGFNVQVLGAFTILRDSPSLVGPLAAVGAGYELFAGRQVSLGAFARVGYLRGYGSDLFGNDVRVDAPFASLAAVFTWH